MDCMLKGVNMYNQLELMPSKKVTVYLPEGAYDKLSEWAEMEGRPISNLAAFILESIVRQHSNQDFALANPKNKEKT
jgi:hypothetical protein